MEISINYRETLFDLANRTPIRGEPPFKTLHKLKIEMKENAKSMYSNLGGGAYGNLGLLLTDDQYALIYNTTFFYLTHPGPLIIPDGTTAYTNSNIRITHTRAM